MAHRDRDTQTSFCISPLAVNCVFAYNIFLLDVIRLVVNIGQYYRKRIRADRHTCMETDMQACVYACTHTRTHAYIHKYTCCFFVFFSQRSDRGNIVSYQLSSTLDSRHIDCANKHSPKGGDNPSGMNMCLFRHRYTHSVLWRRERRKETNTLHLRWRFWLLNAEFKPDMFSFWLW